jgi:hypothetical protein
MPASIELYQTVLPSDATCCLRHSRISYNASRKISNFKEFTPFDQKLGKTYSYWNADVLNLLSGILSDRDCNDLSTLMNLSGIKIKCYKYYPIELLRWSKVMEGVNTNILFLVGLIKQSIHFDEN